MAKQDTYCKLKKDFLKEHWNEIRKEVKEARYICKKCARAAKEEERLCKPEKL